MWPASGISKKSMQEASNSAENQITRHMQNHAGVDEHKGEVDIGWSLFDRARERGEDNRFWLSLDHFNDGHVLQPIGLNQPRKDRRLENAEADVEPDGDHDQAQEKRHTPA